MFKLHNGARMLSLLVALVLMLLLATACTELQDTTSGGQGTATPSPDTSLPPPSSDQSGSVQMVPGRVGSSIAYDQRRGVAILFGGDTGMDTWAWDGQTWEQLFPASFPPARSGASMAYDAASGEIVLFGGMSTSGYPLSDTWLWDGTNWLPASPTLSPSARTQASMAYDIARQRVVLFGGMIVGAGQATSTIADTWTWDGKNWAQVHSAASPPARSQSAMTYDQLHRQIVLFGGFSGNGVMGDTWTWDGKNWTQLHPRTNPVARAGASLVYDSAAEQLVLFAGVADPKVGDLRDMWIWNGSDWQQRAAKNVPGGFYTAATYAAIQQRIVAYVVRGTDSVASNGETWLWDGSAWLQLR